MMKIFIAALAVAMFAATSAFAKDVTYEMQVDGITCPFCVATSTKALKKIDGVKSVSANLETGIITVCTDESVNFTDEQLETLFLDKGFTYRSMTRSEGCAAA